MAFSSNGFTAPEVLFPPEGVALRAKPSMDVFALGCIIYHMHFFPRQLRCPQHIGDEIAEVEDRAWVVDDCSVGRPAVASMTWAKDKKVVDVVRMACRAQPTERVSAAALLHTNYMQKSIASVSAPPPILPVYWQYEKKCGYALVESPELTDKMGQMMMATRSVHRSHGRVLSVSRVWRLENPCIWARYVAKRRLLSEECLRSRYKRPFLPTRTASFNFPLDAQPPVTAAGEYFLFHASDQVELLMATGFDSNGGLSSAVRAGSLGRGIYFTDAVGKADHSLSNQGQEPKRLVVARVLLGRCYVTYEDRRDATEMPELPDQSLADESGSPLRCDSVVALAGISADGSGEGSANKGTAGGGGGGSRNASTGGGRRHSEFMVADGHQAYPEFLVEYTLEAAPGAV